MKDELQAKTGDLLVLLVALYGEGFERCLQAERFASSDDFLLADRARFVGLVRPVDARFFDRLRENLVDVSNDERLVDIYHQGSKIEIDRGGREELLFQIADRFFENEGDGR